MFMYALAYVCIFSLSDAIVIALVLEAYSFSSVHMLLKSQRDIAISYYKDSGKFFFLKNCLFSLLLGFLFSWFALCFVVAVVYCHLKHWS